MSFNSNYQEQVQQPYFVANPPVYTNFPPIPPSPQMQTFAQMPPSPQMQSFSSMPQVPPLTLFPNGSFTNLHGMIPATAGCPLPDPSRSPSPQPVFPQMFPSTPISAPSMPGQMMFVPVLIQSSPVFTGQGSPSFSFGTSRSYSRDFIRGDSVHTTRSRQNYSDDYADCSVDDQFSPPSDDGRSVATFDDLETQEKFNKLQEHLQQLDRSIDHNNEFASMAESLPSCPVLAGIWLEIVRIMIDVLTKFPEESESLCEGFISILLWLNQDDGELPPEFIDNGRIERDLQVNLKQYKQLVINRFTGFRLEPVNKTSKENDALRGSHVVRFRVKRVEMLRRASYEFDMWLKEILDDTNPYNPHVDGFYVTADHKTKAAESKLQGLLYYICFTTPSEAEKFLRACVEFVESKEVFQTMFRKKLNFNEKKLKELLETDKWGDSHRLNQKEMYHFSPAMKAQTGKVPALGINLTAEPLPTVQDKQCTPRNG